MRQLTAPCLAIVASVMLASCVHIGNEYNRDEETISRLVPGETSCDEAIAAIGEPSSVSRSSDGSRIVSYTRGQMQASPYVYAGVFGRLLAGATGESVIDIDGDTLTLTCDADGILTDYQTHSISQ